jgi:hypothetical protein
MGGRVSGYASIGNVAVRRRKPFRRPVPKWRTWSSKAAESQPYGVRGLIVVRGLVRGFKMIADSLKWLKDKVTDNWCVALVAERWYVALVAESCRMEFPVGFVNAPNFFFSSTISTCNCICISVLHLCNFKSNYPNPNRLPRLSLNFASCTRYFFVLFYSFIHTNRLPLPYTKTAVWQSQSIIRIRLF